MGPIGCKYFAYKIGQNKMIDIQNGKEHGNGKLTDNDGWSYDGQWKNGKYHGEGIRQINDGIIIKGNWKKSSMYGKCTISIPKRGDKFETSFIWGWPKAYKNRFPSISIPIVNLKIVHYL